MTATATHPPVADSASDQNGSSPPAWKPELHEIPLDAIDVGTNVRSAAALDVQELAASIRAVGVVSPIRVRDVGAGRYELLYGQRRLAAAKVAGLATIPAIVDDGSADTSGRSRRVAQLIENLHREDLNPIDAAKAYRELLDTGMSQRQLGEQLGIAQPTIANTLALLKQPEAIQQRVAAGELTRSHAEQLAKLGPEEREEVARRVVDHGLSVRDLEREIDQAVQRQTAADRRRDTVVKAADAAEAKLVAKKVDKATAKVTSYDEDLRAELKARGWKTYATRTYRAVTDKHCDCRHFVVETMYGTNDVRIGRECHDDAHWQAKVAAEKAENDRRHQAELAKGQQKRQARIAAVDELAPSLAAHRDRLILHELSDRSWGDVAGEFEAEAGVPSWGDRWSKLLELGDDQVALWIGRFLADAVLDEHGDSALRKALLPAAGKPAKGTKAAKS
jgi:ParB family transcriptional regulator, chromosome partitioning protein